MEAFFSARDNLAQMYKERPVKVLIVDEQLGFCQKIRDILHGIGGFQVVAEMTTCRMALETVERMQIDLVVTELILTDGDAINLTTQLKQLPIPPRVIVFSAAVHNAALLQTILAGGDGYLTKDIPTRDIIRTFKYFERGGPAMQPTVTTDVLHLLVERCKQSEEKLATLAVNTSTTNPLLEIQSSRNEVSPAIKLTPHLSLQEEKVLTLMRRGQSNKQIAAQLSISPYTVSKHVQNILRKLGVANRTQAATYTSFEG